jgi:hypothetical protein
MRTNETMKVGAVVWIDTTVRASGAPRTKPGLHGRRRTWDPAVPPKSHWYWPGAQSSRRRPTLGVAPLATGEEVDAARERPELWCGSAAPYAG